MSTSRLTAVLAMVLIVLAGCARPGSRGGPPAATPTTVAPTPTPTPAPTATTGQSWCQPAAPFDAGNFSADASGSAQVTNRWLPLTPGTQVTLSGTTNEDGERLARRVVTTVTDLTKVIDGVRTRVVLDRDYTEGQLTESELAFFAQDRMGNVWAMGEYPEEYEDGRFSGAPSVWIAGQDGAAAGTIMPADPAPNRPDYLQGYAPRIEFLDCARVARADERLCAKGGACRDGVLVVDENSPLEPKSGHQMKFHAPGVGVVKVTAVDDPEGETLSLTRGGRAAAPALAEARSAALRLEKRAYRINAGYRGTSPLTPG